MIDIKKIITISLIGFIFLNIFTIYVTTQACSKTLYVRNSSSLTTYYNIQDAIDNASDGDIISVEPGIYYENLVINKSITLKSSSTTPELTVIDGRQNGNVIEISANRVNISGFTIQNCSYNLLYIQAGIYIQSNNVSISKNIISNNSEKGIFLYFSNNCHIENNKIINNENIGLYIDTSNNNNLTGNIVFNNSHIGLNIRASNNNTCNKNKMTGNYHEGIFLSSNSENNIISNSNISSNKFKGIRIWRCNNNTIINNTISRNGEDGVDLSYSSNFNVISKNNILKNKELGLRIENCNHNIIFYNNFINNFYNNFINEKIRNAMDNGRNTWYNTTTKIGNYWDDYKETDNNKDGIGDTPYKIIKNYGNLTYKNNDKYPLMKPFQGEIPEKPEQKIDTSFLYPKLVISIIIAIIFCLPIAYYWRKKWYS